MPLRVHVSPPEAAYAGAQWQLNGGPWQNSGTTLFVDTDYHTVTFKPIPGWNTPANILLGAFPDIPLERVGTYTPQPGSLQVQLGPDKAVVEGARWQVDGGAWQASGSTVSLPMGAHTIRFSDLRGWNTPATQVLNIGPGPGVTAWSNYVAQPGSIRVTLTPPDAVAAGALWQVDGGAWRTAGEVVALPPGPHTIAFNAAPEWTTPGDQFIDVASNNEVSRSGRYTADRQFIPGLPTGPAPVITPAGGAFTGMALVSMTSRTNDTDAAGGDLAGTALVSRSSPETIIRYTADGSEPTSRSRLYNGALILTNTVKIKARAFQAGQNASPSAAASFTWQRGDIQPDLLIGTSNSKLVGENLYNNTAENQTTNMSARRGATKTLLIRIENDGSSLDSFRVAAMPSPDPFEVRYYAGSKDVTSEITSGGYLVNEVKPETGVGRWIRMRIRIRPKAEVGATGETAVTITSIANPAKIDAVKVRLEVAGRLPGGPTPPPVPPVPPYSTD